MRRFLREMPAGGEEWAAGMSDRLTSVCGRHLQTLWNLTFITVPGLVAL